VDFASKKTMLQVLQVVSGYGSEGFRSELRGLVDLYLLSYETFLNKLEMAIGTKAVASNNDKDTPGMLIKQWDEDEKKYFAQYKDIKKRAIEKITKNGETYILKDVLAEQEIEDRIKELSALANKIGDLWRKEVGKKWADLASDQRRWIIGFEKTTPEEIKRYFDRMLKS